MDFNKKNEGTTIGSENKRGLPFKIADVFPILFRYIIIIVIFFITFFFFKDKSIQFLLFIIVFILNFFTIVFFYRDLIATNLISELFIPSSSFSLQENGSIFIKIFVGIIFATLLLQFTSIAIMLAVFDYGKQFTNDYYASNMTTINTNLVSEYLVWLKWYFIVISVFVYIIAIAYTKNEKIKNLMVNIGCLIPTGFILGASIYGTILAVKFLDNKKYKRSLYE